MNPIKAEIPRAFYKCAHCKATILARLVEGSYLASLEEGSGTVEIHTRPGVVLCQNPVHGDTPKQMRREATERH